MWPLLRYRLAFTVAYPGLLAISLLDMTVPRLGLAVAGRLAVGSAVAGSVYCSFWPWTGLPHALPASLTVTTALGMVAIIVRLPWPTLRCKWVIEFGCAL